MPPRLNRREALGTAVTARAESKFAFSWRAEPGATCLTEEKLRAAVEKKLGRSVFTSLDEAEIVIEGEELRYRDRFRARVTQHDRAGREHGSRELTAETCAALERMTVVFIALVLEPGGARDRTHGEPMPDARAPEQNERTEKEKAAPPIAPKDDAAIASADASRAPSPPPGVTQRAPSHRAAGVELPAGAGAGAAVGMLPSVSASVRVTMRLTAPDSRLSADWSAGMTLPQIVTEGAVEVTRGRTALVLHAGQFVRPDALEAGQGRVPQEATAWQQGRMAFDGTPLADAVRQIQRYRGAPVTLADDPALAALRLSGDYDVQGVEALIDALPQALPVRVRRAADGAVHIGARRRVAGEGKDM